MNTADSTTPSQPPNSPTVESPTTTCGSPPMETSEDSSMAIPIRVLKRRENKRMKHFCKLCRIGRWGSDFEHDDWVKEKAENIRYFAHRLSKHNHGPAIRHGYEVELLVNVRKLEEMAARSQEFQFKWSEALRMYRDAMNCVDNMCKLKEEAMDTIEPEYGSFAFHMRAMEGMAKAMDTTCNVDYDADVE